MYKKNDKTARRPPVVCDHCTSVLCNFQSRKCKNCRFVASYTDRSNAVYFVAQDYDKKFRTFLKDANTKKRRVYKALEATFSFVEAQSLLNHHAIARNWKTFGEEVLEG